MNEKFINKRQNSNEKCAVSCIQEIIPYSSVIFSRPEHLKEKQTKKRRMYA